MTEVYESDATEEEIQIKIEFMAKQYRNICDQQKIGTPSEHIKIRCGCNKYVGWMYMYRCLYCGIWYCLDCAEEHFGKKRPNRFVDLDEVEENQ